MPITSSIDPTNLGYGSTSPSSQAATNGGTGPGNAGAAQTAAEASSIPVDNLVWPSLFWTIGPFNTHITTRGLHDSLVMAMAVGIGIVGLAFFFPRQTKDVMRGATDAAKLAVL